MPLPPCFVLRIIDCAAFIPALHSTSCAAIRAGPSNSAISGKHFIDVDGMGPLPKVEVECYFKPQSVETVVNTKLAREVSVENTSGQKRVNIPYTADRRSIRSIVMQSQQCSQHIKYVCTKSTLFQSPKGPPQVSIDAGMHFLFQMASFCWYLEYAILYFHIMFCHILHFTVVQKDLWSNVQFNFVWKIKSFYDYFCICCDYG